MIDLHIQDMFKPTSTGMWINAKNLLFDIDRLLIIRLDMGSKIVRFGRRYTNGSFVKFVSYEPGYHELEIYVMI